MPLGRTNSDNSVSVVPATDAAGFPVTQTVGTHVPSPGLGKSLVISDSPCVLRSLKALNSDVSDAWIHIFDSDELPSDGVAPDRIPVPIQAGSVNGDVWEGGTAFEIGCVVALSSTLATLTLITGDTAWFDAELAP